MLRPLVQSVRFIWSATAGYRLRPWASPYMRWRLETYTGKPAGKIVAADFLRMAWHERGQMLRFFAWTGEIRELSKSDAE